MRVRLVELLIRSFRRYLKQDECAKILTAMSDTLPDYVALEMYDMRSVYDEDDDEALEAAHTFGINSPKDTERTLN